MAKKTTVDLSDKAILVKEVLMPIFGLRNILSAGLLLLNKLSSDDLQTIIAEANDKSIALDLYRDRLKLLRINEICKEMLGYQSDHGCQIPLDSVKSLEEAIGDVDKLIPSPWLIDFEGENTVNIPKMRRKKAGAAIMSLSEDEYKTIIQILSEEDRCIFEEFRKSHGPAVLGTPDGELTAEKPIKKRVKGVVGRARAVDEAPEHKQKKPGASKFG